jgi:hypothetical protein
MSNRHSTLGAPRVLMRAVAEKCEAGSRDLQHRRCPHPGSFFVTRAMCGAVGSIRSPPCFQTPWPDKVDARKRPYGEPTLRGRAPRLSQSAHPARRWSRDKRAPPAPSPANRIATHRPVHRRLDCAGGPRAPSGSSLWDCSAAARSRCDSIFAMSSMTVVYWSHKARTRLREIHAYIAQDSPLSATQMVDRLIQRGEHLAAGPRAGISRE